MSAVNEETRNRLLLGALECIERRGLARTTVEDVATQAGLSRSTVYRYFPHGREQLISETVTWEVGRFLTRIVAAITDERGLHDQLVRGLVFGHRAILEHRLLQQMLSTEPEVFLAELTATGPLVVGVIRAHIDNLLEGEDLVEGVDRLQAADYLARMYLSHLGTQGGWDLTDELAVSRLVQTQFLAGICQ